MIASHCVLEPRPSATHGRTLFTNASELANVPKGGAPSVLDRSYTITAEVEMPQGGAEGMLVTDGGRFGGYGFYILKGKPVFVYNFVNVERFRWEAKDALSPGKHRSCSTSSTTGSASGVAAAGP